MLTALLWGLAGGSTLVVGSLIGCFAQLPRRVTAAVMAIGAGVLIASVAYELVGEAADTGSLAAVSLGLGFGSLAFFVGDVLISRSGGSDRKRSSLPTRAGTAAAGSAGAALALGALLDGIPESAAIGITLLEGGAPSTAFIVAVALSNLPEGLSSSVGMRQRGHSVRFILLIWVGIAVASGLAAAVGYAAMGDASPATTAFVLSFAAGAVLTMLASTMLPEAVQEGGPMVGLLTTAGFLAAVLLDRL
ncbi:ZIP family zinc transporter [Kribbella amoyensis]|uniref:ZIP family zinc transporter n=1 Tax=Kribbella amoyensis TaxID=996641 RepID=A0A561BJG0_9ACTN|nr:ZIP family zinc transporter [Kribbella amoyensis]TWD78980.1 ZIP family zinc transporter [Kribbella amoyensis]